eukprot:TRINITY_DN18937_c0_g1_i1.p1 TRINITY_DN18937_c0_g1~~TRINITY_DN18937_c0_g1_i1.p1  ORF type:complete len:1392 (+),score=255.18 TRINITY_DN18937_c0_g1_i1:64-4239(+)
MLLVIATYVLAATEIRECETLTDEVSCDDSIFCFWNSYYNVKCKTYIDCSTLSSHAECSAHDGSCHWLGSCAGCRYYWNKRTCEARSTKSACKWNGSKGCQTWSVFKCTDALYCFNRGTARKVGKQCACDCHGGWSNQYQCSHCPEQFTNDCMDCVRPGVPVNICEPCTNNRDCNDRALSVTHSAASSTGCVCTCKNYYTGVSCQNCAFGLINDCSACAPDLLDDGNGNCVQCSNSVHCNGRAKLPPTPSPSQTECLCSCSDEWTGHACDQCDPIFNQTTCAECAASHVGFPTCRKCHVSTDCNDHALVSFTFDYLTCGCLCSGRWTGPDCSVCPSQYSDCDTGACALNHFGTQCSTCSTHLNCSDHASAVAGSSSGNCNCTCNDQWSGTDCSHCPARFNSTTCDACLDGVDGFINYPTCEQCTVSKHCSGQADEVTAIGLSQCACKCRNKWEGPLCDVCPDKYDAAQDCNACNADRITFPDCILCDNVAHCSGNAQAVYADNNHQTCLCQCSNGWIDDQCSTCPTTVFTGPNCEVCNGMGVWPVCGSCGVVTHCSNRATKVDEITTATGGACNCTCKNYWSGDKCDRCEVPYAGSDCDVCMQGYVSNPGGGCSECTMNYCNNHALRISSTASSCFCHCADKWEGDLCDLCPPQYNSLTCDACAEGYILFPTCSSCDSQCSQTSTTISSSDASRTTCFCKCSGQWYGDQCDSCSPIYEQTMCASCAPGRALYPACEMCSTSEHCNNHAVNVVASDSGCTCECRDMWNGTNCDTCDEKYNDQEDCAECAAHRIEYPECWLCQGSYCNDRAAAMVKSGACVCDTCQNQWTGDRCEVCPDRYSGEKCNECASGVGTPPDCQTCDCIGGNATSVDGVCACECKPGYEQLDATTCRPCFFSGGGCISSSEVCECLCLTNWTSPTCTSSIDRPTIEPTETVAPIVRVSYSSDAVKSITSASSFTISTSGAMGAARLSALLTLCGSADDVLDPEIAPLGLEIGSGNNALYLGGIVGDIIIMITPILIQFAAVQIRAWAIRRESGGGSGVFDEAFDDASADLRFPYLSLFAVIFMYHGMATCSLKLAIFGEAWEQTIGIGTLTVFNLGFLVVVYLKLKGIMVEVEYYEKKGAALSTYMFGKGEWVSATHSKRVSKWGLLFEMYRKGWTWFLIVECFVLLAITVVQVVEATDMLHCRNIAIVLCLFFGIFTLVIGLGCPWASLFDNHVNVIIAGLEAIAMGFLAKGFDTKDRSDGSFNVAEQILVVVSYITLAKGIIDPLLLFYVEWKRRQQMQKKYDVEKKSLMEKRVYFEECEEEEQVFFEEQGELSFNEEDHQVEQDHNNAKRTVMTLTAPGENPLRNAISLTSPFILNPHLSTSLHVESPRIFTPRRAYSSPHIQL